MLFGSNDELCEEKVTNKVNVSEINPHNLQRVIHLYEREI